jgi:predicted metalloendopeptidase
VIHNILEGEYEDLYKNLKDGDTGFHTDDEQEADKQNFKAMKDYYNLCIDTSAMDKLGSTPIYHELSKIQNSIFPVIQNETYSSDKINRMTDILIYLSRSFKDTIVSLSVYNDYKNSNENAIYITSPTLTLQSKQTYEATETLQKFSTLLSDLLTTVIGQPECKACDPEHVETSKDSEFQLWPKEKVQSAVANFITIETALANISTTT